MQCTNNNTFLKIFYCHQVEVIPAIEEDDGFGDFLSGPAKNELPDQSNSTGNEQQDIPEPEPEPQPVIENKKGEKKTSILLLYVLLQFL